MVEREIIYPKRPLPDLSDLELADAGLFFAIAVDTAPGWSSAYAYAKDLQAVCREAQRRGLAFINPFPIRFS